jgi:DNA-binding GntR family transcriptional regulator
MAKTLSNGAYDELRRRILILELIPGERLKEEEWAAKLNVSRTAVREALTRLLGEGLLRAGERGGFFVMEMTAKDIQEIRALREVLETAAFDWACDHSSNEELKAIEQTCKDFKDLVIKGYYAGACECDLRFHHLLVAASGNSHLIQAYQRSNIPLFHMKLGRSRMFTDDYEDTEREHRGIVEALRRRDKEEGKKLLQLHFRRGEELALGKSPVSSEFDGNHKPNLAKRQAKRL